MRGARYVRLIPWTLRSGSEHLVPRESYFNSLAKKEMFRESLIRHLASGVLPLFSGKSYEYLMYIPLVQSEWPPALSTITSPHYTRK